MKYLGPENQRPWSKLGREIKKLFDPKLPLQIHCVARTMRGKNAIGSTRFPRYWITLGKEIIFDYPGQFMEMIDHEAKSWCRSSENDGFCRIKDCYPYEEHDVSEISNLIREYIDREKDKLFEPFENDRWGLIDYLRASDRRIGKRRLEKIQTENEYVKKIIKMRG